MAIATVVILCLYFGKDFKANIWQYVSIGVLVLAFTFGALYYYLGYKKNAYPFYKGFMWSTVAYFGVSIISIFITNNSAPVLPVICYFVSYALAIILAVGKDLKRNLTFVLAIILLVSTIIPFVVVLIDSGSLGNSSKYLICVSIARILLAFNAITYAAAKYLDKKERGRKI